MDYSKFKLASNKEDYITQKKRKYFPIALAYCLQNKIDACKVNRIDFVFDFENMLVRIKSNLDDRFWKHKLIYSE